MKYFFHVKLRHQSNSKVFDEITRGQRKPRLGVWRGVTLVHMCACAYACTCAHTFTCNSSLIRLYRLMELCFWGMNLQRILATVLYEVKAQKLEHCLTDRLRFHAASSWNWNVPSKPREDCHSTQILLDYVILGILIMLKTSHHPENSFQSSELGCPIYGCWQSLIRAINY